MKQTKLFALLMLLIIGSIGASAEVQLHSAMPEGTVGMLHGQEAIVVDLGGTIGKVAVATKNVGATSVDDRTNGACFGNYYKWDDAMALVSDGWYVPSADEFSALITRLKGNMTRKGAELVFPETRTSLFLPSCGYIGRDGTPTPENVRDMYSVYWSSTEVAGRSDVAYDFQTFSNNQQNEKQVEYKAASCLVRQFCTLPKFADYLCFTAVDGDVDIEITGENVIQYSTDWENWIDFTASDKVTIPNGQKLYWRTETARTSLSDDTNYTQFKMTGTGNIEASGNIMSLLDPTAESLTVGDGAFIGLFKGCTKLITAPKLPATTLDKSCYFEMFDGCTGLTEAPELPATTLALGCYNYMFLGCTSLTAAPELPATTLTVACYGHMFGDCTGLTVAPTLPATTLVAGCYSGMFESCTGLTEAPALPATTLAEYCYSNMFYRCTGLTEAPALPATTLSEGCYSYMFYRCTGLTEAPALPATTLATGCYANMFLECTSLTGAPELPATTLAKQCYLGMFDGCTNLTAAPELPAMTLAVGCYSGMFHNCTNLTTAPELPAMTLADGCYAGMFNNCTNLTTAPVLPATTLADGCYSVMFAGCEKLTSVVMKATDASADYCMQNMFEGAAKDTQGELIITKELDDDMKQKSYGLGLPNNWSTVIDDSDHDYLSFTAVDGDVNIGLVANEFTEPITLEYSTDKIHWNKFEFDQKSKPLVTINNGETYYFRRGGEAVDRFYPDSYISFTMSGEGTIEAGGNVMSLLDPTCESTTVGQDGFNSLFYGCGLLTKAPELPATNLAPGCYREMFAACGSLETAPELPATELSPYCYSGMFAACESLTTAPTLSATVLAQECYEGMFGRCISLTTAPELPATVLAEGCYLGMFVNCINLEEAPELSAPILKNRCYTLMFENCVKLSSVRLGISNASENFMLGDVMNGWLEGTAEEGNIVLTSGFYLPLGYKEFLRIPEGWSVSRELKANEDPNNEGVYYTTFYDGYSSYSVAEGTKAYTGTVDGDYLKLTATADNKIAATDAVVLKGNTPTVLLTIVDDEVAPVEGNVLEGCGFTLNPHGQPIYQETPAPANCYILSYGTNGVGFYKYSKTLTAHKAYLVYEKSAGAKGLSMVFAEDDPDGINPILSTPNGEDAIYNLQGIRQSKLQKGINIVGGKKVIVK